MKRLFALGFFLMMFAGFATAQTVINHQGGPNSNSAEYEGLMDIDFCDNCAYSACGNAANETLFLIINGKKAYTLFFTSAQYKGDVVARWEHVSKQGATAAGVSPGGSNLGIPVIITGVLRSNNSCPIPEIKVQEITFLGTGE